MSSAKSEYGRFLGWLCNGDSGEDVRRLAIGIAQHFEEVSETGVQNSARARKVVELLRPGFLALPSNPGALAAVDGPGGIPWTRLTRIQVGPFRGFTQPEEIRIDRRIVLVYGPNGSGKSSLCEALEYALTQEIAEASSKRIGLNQYCVNAHVDRFHPPILFAVNRDGNEIQVEPNLDKLRFCLIEKNRIDEFARLCAQLPRQQQNSIASLFGTDEFSGFVHSFNESVEGQLDLFGKASEELRRRREGLVGAEQTIQSSPGLLGQIDEAAARLAQEFRDGWTAEQLRLHIGNAEVPGRLAAVTTEIERPLPSKIDLSPEGLQALVTSYRSNLAELAAKLGWIEHRRTQVSFRRLFEAVEALRPESPDACPACDTPLAGPRAVATNPFEKARHGLEQLRELADVEERISTLQADTRRDSISLRAYILRVIAFAASQSLKYSEATGRTITELQQVQAPESHHWPPMDSGFWTELADIAAVARRHDDDIGREEVVRGELRVERDRLFNLDREIYALDERRKAIGVGQEEAAAQIRKFEADNAVLIGRAEAERKEVETNLTFSAAYTRFLGRLRAYRDALPEALTRGLSEATRRFYNSFNHQDHQLDLLAGLWLPTLPNGQVQVSFARNPNRRFDALHVMSEGHIRCLGLSILVAKNVQAQCPVLVFDDAVNAIDDDHRSGICQCLFGEPELAGKQIILTSHGEEFVKSIHQRLGSRTIRDESLLYVFLPRDADLRLNIDTNPRSRNYIILSQDCLNRLEVRDALANGRRALESLMDRAWRWASNQGFGELSVRLRSPNVKPDLRNILESLYSAISVPAFRHERKDRLLPPMQTLRGIDGNSLEWRYLNGGTHEAERGEFDRAVVRTIVDSLVQIDQALAT